MIYTIKLVDMRKEKGSENSLDMWVISNRQTVGYFSALNSAIDAVMNNSCGLFERYHDCEYIAIEEYDEGIFPRKKNTKWLQRKKENGVTTIQELNLPITL